MLSTVVPNHDSYMRLNDTVNFIVMYWWKTLWTVRDSAVHADFAYSSLSHFLHTDAHRCVLLSQAQTHMDLGLFSINQRNP